MQTSPPVVRRLPPNTQGRDFYIGDLHGCVGPLHHLLQHVGFDSTVDRVISVGDLVDRGEDSLGATALVDEHWFHAVLGNHELMTLGALSIPPYTLWAYELRYGEHHRWHRLLTLNQLEQVGRRLASLPLAIEVEQPDGRLFGVIHAQIEPRPGWAVLHQLAREDLGPFSQKFGRLVANAVCGRDIHEDTEAALGIRRNFLTPFMLNRDRHKILRRACRTRGVDLLISGHIVTRDYRPLAVSNRLAIDTGAFFGEGALSLVEPRSGRYWQVGGERGGDVYSLRVIECELPKPHSAWDVRRTFRKVLAGETPAQIESPCDVDESRFL